MQVRPENIYFLLSYAWQRLDESDRARVCAEEVRNAEELFARVLCRAAHRLLRQRLDRGYVETTDDLRRPRGKIHVARSEASGIAMRGALECDFDEHTEDLLHNRIIRATVKRLATVEGLTPTIRHDLREIWREMRAVADVPISARDFRQVQLHANIRRYRFALNVCELLHRCLLPHEREGEWRFRTFTGDEREMGRLFEEFVREFLRLEQTVFDDVRSRNLVWIATGDTSGMLPEMRTDITMRRPGQSVVIETKCVGDPLANSRRDSKPVFQSDHLYQLAAYLANFPASGERVSGMLLYAVDDENDFVPKTRMTWLQHEIFIMSLNLSRPWKDIDRQLREMVDWIASDARPTHSTFDVA
ncbi:MAG: hypothetical protein IT350_13225 [Deltaproteobacteria bacterium]|nr:hypothetical protein [Deltaproteobacteria bacterium]